MMTRAKKKQAQMVELNETVLEEDEKNLSDMAK